MIRELSDNEIDAVSGGYVPVDANHELYDAFQYASDQANAGLGAGSWDWYSYDNPSTGGQEWYIMTNDNEYYGYEISTFWV